LILGAREETPDIEKVIAANTHLFVTRTNKNLPRKFTWAGTKADGVVKDQAICGSCWVLQFPLVFDFNLLL